MQVYAIGNPFGLDHTLTQGIISGLGRELQTPGPRGLPLRNVIQTDAAINPGARDSSELYHALHEHVVPSLLPSTARQMK